MRGLKWKPNLKSIKNFLIDNKAQVSAELILVMAAVLAVAILLVKQLQDTAKSGSKKLDEKTEKVLKEIDKIK